MKDICMVLSICMNIGMPACLAADLSIDEAVDMALAKNNDVKIANEEKMAAQANYEATKGANGVSISLGIQQNPLQGLHLDSRMGTEQSCLSGQEQRTPHQG